MKLFGKTFAVLGVFALGALQIAFAEDQAGAAEAGMGIIGYLAIGSGLGLGIAALGGALGQGRMVASAMDGISRNPKAAGDMFVPMILGLAFIEALSIYALIFPFIFKAAVL